MDCGGEAPRRTPGRSVKLASNRDLMSPRIRLEGVELLLLGASVPIRAIMRVATVEIQILEKLTDLPPFAPVLVKLLGTFGQANISCAALAALIEQDPV